MSYLSPEERERIAEEQRIRNRETMKTGIKTLGKVYLIVGAVIVLVLLCSCLALTGVFSSIGGGG